MNTNMIETLCLMPSQNFPSGLLRREDSGCLMHQDDRTQFHFTWSSLSSTYTQAVAPQIYWTPVPQSSMDQYLVFQYLQARVGYPFNITIKMLHVQAFGSTYQKVNTYSSKTLRTPLFLKEDPNCFLQKRF